MRNLINLNQDWRFIQKNVGLPEAFPSDWDQIHLPHTWNAVDGHDGNGSYDRGTYWYAKSFATPNSRWQAEKYLWSFRRPGSRPPYM